LQLFKLYDNPYRIRADCSLFNILLGRAVKAKGASLGGRGFDKRKKLKIVVNTTVSRQQTAQGESEIFKTFRFWKPFEH